MVVKTNSKVFARNYQQATGKDNVEVKGVHIPKVSEKKKESKPKAKDKS